MQYQLFLTSKLISKEIHTFLWGLALPKLNVSGLVTPHGRSYVFREGDVGAESCGGAGSMG